MISKEIDNGVGTYKKSLLNFYSKKHQLIKVHIVNINHDVLFECSKIISNRFEMSYDVKYGRIDNPGALQTYTQPSQGGVDPNNLEAFVSFQLDGR